MSAGDANWPLLVERQPEPPLVDLFLVSRSGTLHDPPGREGALAIGLRSLRRGAGALNAQSIEERIDGLGAEFGTSADVAGSAVHVSVIRRNLEPMFALLGDLLTRPTFPDNEVAQVIREARADLIDARNDDRTLAGRAFRRTLFKGHPYGRPASGTIASLDNVSLASARAAFEATYVRSNLVIGAAGDITPEELATLTERHLGGIPARAAPSGELPEPTPRQGRRLVLVDKPERTQTQIFIGGLGTHPTDRDHTALSVANTIFGGSFTARLMREVRSKRGWSYGASSRIGRGRVRDAWQMWTFPAARDAAACIALQLELLEAWVSDGVTERELSFAKKLLTRSYAFDVDTASKRLNQRLDELVTPLPAHYYRDYVKRIEAVTLDQANRAVRKRISPKDLLVTVVGTASELRDALERAIPGLEHTDVVAYDRDELPS